MKIYLSGPMAGIKDDNYPEFHRVAGKLRSAGHEVYNPAEWEMDNGNYEPRAAFADFCDYICKKADAIYMLDGWKHSQGAQCEYRLAVICGVTTYSYAAGQGVLEV